MLHSKVYMKSSVSTHALSPSAKKNVTPLMLFYICEAEQH